MIKINLFKALSEVAPGVAVDGGAGASAKGGAKLAVSVDAQDLAAFRKIFLAVAVYGLGTWIVDSQQEEALKAVDAEIAAVNDENQKLQAEASKISKLEEIKRSIEADEQAMQIKIDTMNKLLSDRQVPPKMLMSLSTSLPGGIWLTDLQIGPSGLSFKGYGVEFNSVSDFMRALGEVSYFTNVQLKSTSQVEEPQSHKKVAQFEITAARK